MQDFKKLMIWQKGHDLTIRIYKVTKDFPKEELYGITSQLRRACASIPTNIAEGCGQDSNPQFTRFLLIAMGSASELEYLLLLAHDLLYINDALYSELSDSLNVIRRMLNSLIQKTKKPTVDNKKLKTNNQ